MRKQCLTLLEGLILFLMGASLVLYPTQSAQGARVGVNLCLELLIPSLFPFFVLSSLFIATGFVQICSKPTESMMRRVFGVSGPGAAAFCLGLIGGYPAGARAVAQLVEQSVCSQKEARRLSLFCNNCGPAFFLGAVGIGVFGQENVGFLLLAANLASAVSIGIFANILLGSAERSPPQPSSTIKRTSLINVFPDCIRSSFSATLNVCAYVILFSVISALADHTGLLPALGAFLGDLLPYTDSALLSRSLCIGLLEISTGTAALQGSTSLSVSLPLAAFLLGWGGFSVHCQSLPFWRQAGVQMLPYLTAKLLQGVLSAAFTVLGMHILPLSQPTMMSTEYICPFTLPNWEIIALWGLAGIYFFFFPQKNSRKDSKDKV